jgi:hypothetical protein
MPQPEPMTRETALTILSQVEKVKRRGRWNWETLRVKGRHAVIDAEFDASPTTVQNWFRKVGAAIERIETIPGGTTIIVFARGQW